LGTDITSYENTGLSSGLTYWYRVRSYNSEGDSDYSNVASTSLPTTPTTSTIIEFDFEDGDENTWPTDWVKDANASAAGNGLVSDPVDSSNQALRLFGSVGGCWGALTYTPCDFPTDFYIECDVYNGTETLSGCHPDRGNLGMRNGTSWSNPARRFFLFKGDGDILGTDNTTIGTYNTGEWYHVKVHYSRIGANLTMSYWINGASAGQSNIVIDDLAREESLDHFELTVQEGSSIFDNIKVYTDGSPAILAAPGSLSASSISSSQISLSWADNSTNETGFNIERSTNSATSGFEQIATVGIDTISYENTGLSTGVSYWYRVNAYNNDGDSDYSNIAIATTPTGETVATPTFSPGNGSLFADSQNLTISCATSGATIRYTTDGNDPTSSSGTVYSGAFSITSYTTIRAIAYKTGSNNSSVSSVTLIQLLPPTGVSATDGASTTHVRVSWNSVALAQVYTIYRASSPNGTYNYIGNTYFSGGTGFYDNNATPMVTYYYKVRSEATTMNITSNFSLYDEGYASAETIPEPNLSITNIVIDDDSSGDSIGDGDGIAEVGETLEIDVEVRNNGPGRAYSITAIAIVNDEDIADDEIEVRDDDISINDLEAGESDNGSDFDFIIHGMPSGDNIDYAIRLEYKYGNDLSGSVTYDVDSIDVFEQNQNAMPVITKVSGPDDTVEFRSVYFHWSADDSDGSVTHYEYSKDGDSWESITNSYYSWFGYSIGSHTFRVRAVDNNNLESEIIGWSFRSQPIRIELNSAGIIYEGQNYSISGRIYEYGDLLRNETIGIHDGLKLMSQIVTTNSEGTFLITGVAQENNASVIEFLVGEATYAITFNVLDANSFVKSLFLNELVIVNSGSSTGRIEIRDSSGSLVDSVTVLPNQEYTILSELYPDWLSERDSLHSGYTFGAGSKQLMQAGFSYTVDDENIGRTEIEFGGLTVINFGVYYTEDRDYGFCWAPGLKVSAGADLGISGKLCIGSDGLSTGVDISAGFFTGGYSIQLIEN